MATDRIISPTETPGDQGVNWALRPETLDEYVGQRELIERISIAVGAVQARAAVQTEPLEHVLLHGPPGLGKTTLAHVIGKEMGTKVYTTSGPALARGTDLVAALTVEEFIYPAMEDFKIDICLDTGLNARTVEIKCQPFTLIGATTRAGLLSAPLRSRFGIAHHLRYYDPTDLLAILRRSAALMGVPSAPDEALARIADRSRGTPRIANRLLRRVRDYATVRHDGGLTPSIVDDALRLEGVDALGLDDLDRSYLRTIGTTYSGGPVGLETVAATMNEDAGTLEDVVEPFLLQIGFLARTRRGRALTRASADHLGLTHVIPPSDAAPASLF